MKKSKKRGAESTLGQEAQVQRTGQPKNNSQQQNNLVRRSLAALGAPRVRIRWIY
jgi:hypothetical protein